MFSSTFRRSVMPVCLVALLGLGAAVLRGQSDPRYAFAVAGGVVWAGGGEPDVTWVGGEGEPTTVWSADEGITYVAQAGPRLAIGSWEALYTLTPGTWKAVKTETGRSITAMAASASTAVAFAGAGTVWLLEADGRWDFHPSGITGLVIEVAFARGRWVAVGSSAWVPPEGVDEDSEEGRPPATWYPSARIWTSTDGKTWTEAPLPDQDDGGTAALSTVAGGPQGFLAISEAGEACYSPDGLTWTLRSAPMDFETGGNAPILRALGGAFWLQEENYEETGKLYRTVDAQTWELQPRAEGAERAALFVKDGIVHAVGRRKEGRGLGFAAVTEYAKVPEPNAADIAAAAAKASEEKRLAEEKAAAERRAVEERARAAEQAANEKRLAEQRAQEEAVRPLVAALGAFDAAILAATTYDAMGKPLGELVKAVEGKVAPALADAIYLSAREVMSARGGALGVHAFSMNIPDSRLGALMTYLREQGTPAHREIIRGLSTQTLDRLYNRPVTPVDTRGWPPAKREAVTASKSDIWDLNRVRTVLLSGSPGAVVELQLAYTSGQSAPVDQALAAFWAGVVDHLLPELRSVRNDNDRFFEIAMNKGSAFGRLWRAQRLSDTRGSAAEAEVRALLDEATAGGFKEREKFLGEYRAQWAKAGGAVAAEPRRFEYTWKMPPALAPAEAALAQFEREFVAAESLSQVGAPAARLVAVLEEKLPRAMADTWLMGVTKFVAEFAGVEGYLAYRRALPPALVPLASAFVLAHHEQMINRVLAQPGGAIPADVLREWPARERRKEARREEQNLYLDHVRVRLLEGSAGAALDLGMEYFNGRGVPTDRNLLYFFLEIASAIRGGGLTLPDRDGLIDFLVGLEAAQGSYLLAESLMTDDAVIITDPEVRRPLETAAQSGHALAAMKLSMSYVAELDAQVTATGSSALHGRSVYRNLLKAEGLTEGEIVRELLALDQAEAFGPGELTPEAYFNQQRQVADAHRQLADLAFKRATRGVAVDELERDRARAIQLRRVIRLARLHEKELETAWAMSLEGSLRQTRLQSVALRELALEGFEDVGRIEVTYGAAVADPAKATAAPQAQIHYGRKLVEFAATLPPEGRVERLKAWLAANPRPSAWDSDYDAQYSTMGFGTLGVTGESFTGLDLANAWLPWFGYQPLLHSERALALARQGRRDEALIAFDLYHALRGTASVDSDKVEAEEQIRETDPALWTVPEEPYDRLLIPMLKIADDASNQAPLSVLEAEAAQRTLGRRLELAARLPVERRGPAIEQVLKGLHELQQGYVPFGLPDRFNPFIKQTGEARSAEEFSKIQAALPPEAAGTPTYWQIRATAASYVEPELAEGLIDIVQAMQPNHEWLKLPAGLVRERARGAIRRAVDGPPIPAAIQAALKDAERAQLKSDAAGMKAAVERALAQDAASIPAKLMRARLNLAQGGTAEVLAELRIIAQDTTLHAKYRGEAWGILAMAEVEATQRAAAANPATAAEAMTRMATAVKELAGAATALRPNQPEAHLALIMVGMAGGQTALQDPAKRAEMRTHLDAALSDRKDHPQALMMRGQIHGIENRLPEATADFELLAKEYPEMIPVRIQLMQVYAKQRRWGDAERQIADLQKLGFPQAAQLRQQLQAMQQASGGGGNR